MYDCVAFSSPLIILELPCEVGILVPAFQAKALNQSVGAEPRFKLGSVTSNCNELFVAFLPIFLSSHFKQMVRQYAPLSQQMFMAGRKDEVPGIKLACLSPFPPSFLPSLLPSFLFFFLFRGVKLRSLEKTILYILDRKGQ